MLVRAAWLNGTVGTGKTTVGEVLVEHLADAGEAVAFINTDDLGVAWPRPAQDPFNVRLATKNLAALASNYAAAGSRTMVVAGVVQTNAQLERYATALGIAPRSRTARCIAAGDRATPPRPARRARRRWPSVAPCAWPLELDAILDDSDLLMTVVENHGTPLADKSGCPCSDRVATRHARLRPSRRSVGELAPIAGCFAQSARGPAWWLRGPLTTQGRMP